MGDARGGWLESLCYSGANLVPVAATRDAVVAFADRALRQGRRCSSVVGAATEVQPLWGLLRPHWGPAREVRPVQPLMVTQGPPLVPPDPLVRRVRPDEIDILWPACVAMFTEEVGVSPTSGDGGASYRARLEQLIRSGRAFARIEGGQVIFKAEIGAVTPRVCRCRACGSGRSPAARAWPRRAWPRSWWRRPARSRRWYRFTSTTSMPPLGRPTCGAGFTETGRLMSVLF